jgi:hypothetical protein
MHFDVYEALTYEPEMKPLAVLRQVSGYRLGSETRKNSFSSVNMVTPPHIPMPALINLSFRSAEMLLKNNKSKLGDTTYKPDSASGAVLEQFV